MIGFAATLRIFLFLGVAFAATIAGADQPTEEVPGILVEEAVVKPAKRGEMSTLQFKVTNFGSNRVLLETVRSNAAQTVDILMTVSGHERSVLSGIPILPEETLDLSSSHISVVFRDLKSPIDAGSSVEFQLVFNGFTTTAVAHAH